MENKRTDKETIEILEEALHVASEMLALTNPETTAEYNYQAFIANGILRISTKKEEINKMLGHKPIDKTKKYRAIKNPKPLEVGEYDSAIEIDGEIWYYDNDDTWFEEFDAEMFNEDEWGCFAEEYVDENGKKDRKIDYAVLVDGFRKESHVICEPLDYINDMVAEGVYKLIRRG